VSSQYLKTPLFAAFFCVLLNACKVSDTPTDTAVAQCPDTTTSIAAVQGDAYKSPMAGEQVTVQGVVTLIQQGQGFYMEESGSDADGQASNAVFIQHTQPHPGIKKGALVSVQGKVTELGESRDTLTALSDTTDLVVCSAGNALPLTDISLPLDGPGREALEGMRVLIDDKLVVTGVYQFDQGKFTLSANGVQYTPTELVQPGPATNELMAKNRAAALPVLLPQDLKSPALVVNGTSTDRLTGVMAHDKRGKRLTIQSVSDFSAAQINQPAISPPDTLRIVGMNLHNYFNGDGKGLGFPTRRGAETIEAFQQQRNRIGAAIGVLDPHVIAVMELENDGFGPHSAAQDLIQLANGVSHKPWAVTRPLDDNTGSDQIAVGIFYRSDRLKAIGPAQTLEGDAFRRSRQPQAQLFQQIPDGETLLIVINHLKSKGSCPESGVDANQNDGQGCWNDMRRVAAKKMSAWAKQLAASMGTENTLILGDMNAYRNEDPIGSIRDAGFTELMERNSLPTYSFVYAGQRGTLDYAFSSDALLGKVQKAYIWNVNAAFPAKVALPQPWLGFSDHDPVVVELRLRHSSTSD
jgi:predicted extracellular nuclease